MQRRLFVILEHNHPFLHWDFLIEAGDGLASWRLLDFPESGKRICAASMPDHRRHYLTWEGPVGGGRGRVRQIYSGELECQGVWPVADDWAGRRFHVVDSGVAEYCQLVHGDCDEIYWEFS